MGQVILYSHTEKDLEKVIEKVVVRFAKQKGLPNILDEKNDDRLNQKQAAKFLGISVTSIIDYKKRGMIPYYQIGRHPFFSKKELLEVARQGYKSSK